MRRKADARIRGIEAVVGLGLIGTKNILSLWYKVKTKTMGFGMIGTKTIVGLGLIDTEAIESLWYDVKTETYQ